MYPQHANDKSEHTQKVEPCQLQLLSSGLQSSQNDSKDQTIQKKVELQLYLHFQNMLSKSQSHYDQCSQFCYQKVSNQQIVNETIKYLNYLKENIEKLPPQHTQQLLFLLNYFNTNNNLITNQYCISSVHKKDPTSPAMFYLSFSSINQKFDVGQFSSLDNWNHVLKLSFGSCEWFADREWKAIVASAGNFGNLKTMILNQTKVSQIKEEDIGRFKSLELISLMRAPLSKQSQDELRKLKKTNTKLEIYF